MTEKRAILAISLLILAVLLAGCAGNSKKKAVRNDTAYLDGQQCLFELAAAGISARSWNAPGSGQCPVSTPISVNAAGAAFEPPLNSSCAMIRQWALFVPVMNRLAQRHLGSPIRTVHHLGSYSCRRMTGNAGRMSLHAQARALDLYAFDSHSGVRVSIEKDWHSRGPKRDFLHALSRESCKYFGVVLTPNHDRAHRDHIHIDIGPWKLCKV
jgi:hypothetical protein